MRLTSYILQRCESHKGKQIYAESYILVHRIHAKQIRRIFMILSALQPAQSICIADLYSLLSEWT